MQAEDPIEKIHASSTNSSGKSKRFILQFPTVTPLWRGRWLSSLTISNSYGPGLFKFFGRGHISYCTTVRGPDILCQVIFSGYVTFYQRNTFFVNTFFHYWQNAFYGRAKWLRRSDLSCGPWCGEPWYRLWRGVVTAHTIVGVQHQRWTVVSYLRR